MDVAQHFRSQLGFTATAFGHYVTTFSAEGSHSWSVTIGHQQLQCSFFRYIKFCNIHRLSRQVQIIQYAAVALIAIPNFAMLTVGGASAGRDKRPIVEFALESAQAVRKMATKQAWQRTQTQGQRYPSSSPAGIAIAACTHCPTNCNPLSRLDYTCIAK